jgi:hypothetical protein
MTKWCMRITFRINMVNKTLRICNTFSFSTATMAAGTRLECCVTGTLSDLFPIESNRTERTRKEDEDNGAQL